MANKYNVQLRTGLFVQTLNGTYVVIGSFTTESNKAYYIEATTVAMRTNGDAASGLLTVATFKNAAGTVTQIGTTTAVVSHKTIAGWDQDFLISGTDIGIRVRGDAGIVNHRVDLEIREVGLEAELT